MIWKRNNIEIWQIAFNPQNIQSFDLPIFVEALCLYILQEANRIYWNVYQQSIDFDSQEWVEDKFSIRPYDWNSQENKNMDFKANIEFDWVLINFYKHFWRWMTCNIKKSKNQWISWFEKFNKTLIKFEKDNFKINF